MLVKNDYLFLDNGTQVTFKKSPNHGGLKKAKKYLIIHYDASNNATSAVNWMLSPISKVSAELWIGRDGAVVQLLDFNTTAYHAGVSEWKGIKGLNSYSIGIELQNDSVQDYTQKQLDVLLEVSLALQKAYNFDDVLGHSDIAKGRKVDPGIKFPMSWLRTKMFSNAIDNNQLNTTTTADVNLRSGAGVIYQSISVIKKGTSVVKIENKDGWSKVSIDGKIGFIKSIFLHI